MQNQNNKDCLLKDLAYDSVIYTSRAQASIYLDVLPKWPRVISGADMIRQILVGWLIELEYQIVYANKEIRYARTKNAKENAAKRRADLIRAPIRQREVKQKLAAECTNGINQMQKKISVATPALIEIRNYLKKMPLIEEAVQRYAANKEVPLGEIMDEDKKISPLQNLLQKRSSLLIKWRSN